MNIFLKLIIVFIVSAPEFRFDWLTLGDNSKFKASLIGYNEQLQRCAASGLALRLRYEFQICEDKKLWFDECKDVKRAMSSFEYDPISETYLVTKDFLGDVDLPMSERVEKLDKAIAKVSILEDVSFAWIAGKSEANPDLKNIDPKGLRGRIVVECRGNYSESVKRLSSFLSLGLIRTSEFDSNWVKFSQ